MGAVSERPDNGLGVQASTPTRDFLAYAAKKKAWPDLPDCPENRKTLVVPEKEGHDGKCEGRRSAGRGTKEGEEIKKSIGAGDWRDETGWAAGAR